MSTEKLVPDEPDKWRVTAGTKQGLLVCKMQLQTALQLRKLTQDEFAKLIVEHWPKILKAILNTNKKV